MAATKPPIWWEDAQEVDEQPRGSLTIAELASLTGLASSTIQTAINSVANTGRRARLQTIARPAYRWQGVPLWSIEQASAYHDKVAARWSTRKEFAHLPTYTAEQAIEHQVTSLRGIERLTTVPLTTLHRWKLGADWPLPAALMQVNSPTPRLLYSWPAVRDAIKEHHADWLAAHPDVVIDGARVTETTDPAE
jgi:hypothetical protein